MTDTSDCAVSIAAMVKDWYESPHKSDIPATLIDRRMARFQPSHPLAALAMRERAANEKVIVAIWSYYGDLKNSKKSIRAIPTTFTDAELLAAAMQLPEVRALIEAADKVDDEYRCQQYGPTMHTIDILRTALAPFTKVGE